MQSLKYEERIAVLVVVWVVLGGLATIETMPDAARLVLFFAPALMLLAGVIFFRD